MGVFVWGVGGKGGECREVWRVGVEEVGQGGDGSGDGGGRVCAGASAGRALGSNWWLRWKGLDGMDGMDGMDGLDGLDERLRGVGVEGCTAGSCCGEMSLLGNVNRLLL